MSFKYVGGKDQAQRSTIYTTEQATSTIGHIVEAVVLACLIGYDRHAIYSRLVVNPQTEASQDRQSNTTRM